MSIILWGLLATLGAMTDWWWIDEAGTWDLLQRDLRSAAHILSQDVHPPLYFLGLSAWHHWLPQPRAMKLFSMGWGLVALLGAALAGRLMFGKRAGLLTCLLWATFPMFLQYSQEARMYSMALAFETFALAGWALRPRQPKLGWWIFVSASVLGLYTHNFCLIFVAALAGGEMIRCLLATRFNTAAHPAGWKWIGSASLVIGVCYLPWTFILFRQIHNQAQLHFFAPPSWQDIYYKGICFPYVLHHDQLDQVWAPWLGLLVLVLLPALQIVKELRRGPRAWSSCLRPSLLMLAGVSVVPVVFLALYSKWVNPMFEISRHGVLFIPFAIFLAAAWLRGICTNASRRVAAVVLIGLVAANALVQLSIPRHEDKRVYRDAMIEQAPLGAPVVLYPPQDVFTLPWSPLELTMPGQEPLERCTLLVDKTDFAAREEITRQANLLIAQAASVKEVYVSYQFSAYYLTGLPPQALSTLMQRRHAFDVANDSRVIQWKPTPLLSNQQLLEASAPRGTLVSFSPLFPTGQGLRLASPSTQFAFPAAEVPQGGFGAIMVAGRFYGIDPQDELFLRAGEGPLETVERIGWNEFFASSLVGLSTQKLTFQMQVPPQLTANSRAPYGEVPAGVYLTWAGLRTLNREEFQQPGFEGEFFDIGTPGDQLYVREGFYEAEGAPPSEIRWTHEQFELELPVWNGTPLREVILRGMLPAGVKDRTVRVEMANIHTHQTTQAQVHIVPTDYGEYAIALPHDVPAGVYRLTFNVGTWVPAQQDPASQDPRSLGFFLDGVGLRRAL